MGGDHGLGELAAGLVSAFREWPGRFTITLVGDQAEIGVELKKAGADRLPIEIVHAPERIDMAEKAAAAVRRKTASSLGVMIQLHKQGHLDAVFSAGNTGAVVAAALLGLGRLEGVSRPALAAFFPNPSGGAVVLDVGANAQCKAPWLVQFAHMGSVYARYLLERRTPRIGLLSIGEEDTKGNDLVLEVLPLLKAETHLHVIGNVEGRDVFKGTCDVVVTDGFTGNVVLKTAESAAGFLMNKVKQEVMGDPLAMAGAVLMRPAMSRVRRAIDWEEHAAVPLLGVDGVCFIGHGSSRQRAFRSAIRTVATFVEKKVNEHIREEIGTNRDSAA
ncbi:MAG: phosphate acyltransferase PlsX [Candidatus Eisenbacteria bacterium]|uniref:Phosphate acyltransferase n=1 Tax=Eiseniibacteriota bacterium TaxID=2212470 RepID=A0A849SP56_UNCEI|nr:phosphate acyltransferase PlsX [Candidatus Eisenbacteria bacterium]